MYKLTDSTGTTKITWYDNSVNTTVTDQFIENESVSKEANITVLPRGLMNSDLTDVFDFGGVTRTITITCVTKQTSLANMSSFLRNTLMALVQGDQSLANNYPYQYFSDMLGGTGAGTTAIKVKFLGVDFNYVAGDPLKVRYTIKMVESSEL